MKAAIVSRSEAERVPKRSASSGSRRLAARNSRWRRKDSRSSAKRSIHWSARARARVSSGAVVVDPRLRRRQLLRPVGHVLLEDGEEEVGLAGEVGVDGAVRVAGLLGDLLDRGALVAALGEDAGGGGDQLGAGARLLLCSCLAFRRLQAFRL